MSNIRPSDNTYTSLFFSVLVFSPTYLVASCLGFFFSFAEVSFSLLLFLATRSDVHFSLGKIRNFRSNSKGSNGREVVFTVSNLLYVYPFIDSLSFSVSCFTRCPSAFFVRLLTYLMIFLCLYIHISLD